MSRLRASEWEGLKECYDGAIIEDGDGRASVAHLPQVSLPSGWSAQSTSVWFVIPPAYPSARLDCFWADADLRLASGGMPANARLQAIPVVGAQALWFSWHLRAWQPALDDVLTYVRFILRRFADAR